MEVSDVHTKLGEAFGFVCWMWIFHRARNDLPVVLGWRHPWEHAEDPWASVTPKDDDIDEIDALRACLLYTSPSPRDMRRSRMPSSA